MVYMYAWFAWSLLIFVLVLLYFPARPPRPPSISASRSRMSYLAGFRTLLGLPQFWLVGMAYAVSGGVYIGWGSVLDINVSGHGISQRTAGFVGCAASLAGNAIGVPIGVFADFFKRHMKMCIILLFSGAAVFTLIFTLAYVGCMEFSMELLYGTNILISICVMGGVPLFFELCCEMAYPVSEGMATMVLTLMNNIVGLVFLFLLMIPDIGDAWMNWTLLGSIVVCVPMMLLSKVQYARLHVDSNPDTEDSSRNLYSSHPS